MRVLLLLGSAQIPPHTRSLIEEVAELDRLGGGNSYLGLGKRPVLGVSRRFLPSVCTNQQKCYDVGQTHNRRDQ
ncbi:MAG: hypothetical protein C7B46_04620 [Sulfobacillus benefaciens]|uniref:Uncharacterized protein n=1 Tax=Sulfobacillus benefaciens TaxID=453960 RepID=A0A2T2XJP5_9FIRM|nr:MAG: hypothetical protein C7B46_04620 [Sulfobacillus benefaciens]